MAYRSLPPLPISMWINIRVLSMEAILRRVDFPDPQACSISSGQRDTIAQSLNRFQKADDFLGIQDRRKLLRLSPENDPFEGLLLSQGNAIEEPQGACDSVDVRPRMVLCEQMQLVGADLLHAETIGG